MPCRVISRMGGGLRSRYSVGSMAQGEGPRKEWVANFDHVTVTVLGSPFSNVPGGHQETKGCLAKCSMLGS